MQYRTNRWISLILTLCLIVSGVYFENSKVNAFSNFMYAEGAIDGGRTDIQGMLIPSVLTKVEGCTAEMLGIRENAGMEQVTVRLAEQRKGIDATFQFLCQGLYSPFGDKSFAGLKAIGLASGKRSKLLTNYIHKTDGKKRI